MVPSNLMAHVLLNVQMAIMVIQVNVINAETKLIVVQNLYLSLQQQLYKITNKSSY
jgi:hypothetical protein